MNRIVRIAGIAALALILLSCDAFFSAKLGRWNPLDPDNELVTLTPTVDGYVDGSVWDQTSTSLTIYPSSMAAVIIFPANQLPEEIRTAYLRIYKPSALSGDPNIVIHPILASALPDTYTDVDKPGVYFNGAVTQPHTLSNESGWELIELREFFPASADIISKGIVIFSTNVSITLSSSEGGFPPQLLVEPN